MRILEIVAGLVLGMAWSTGSVPQARADDAPKGMVLVPDGAFLFGCNDSVDQECNLDERPGKTLELPAFWIGKTEVTRGDWSRCVVAGACDRIEADRNCRHIDRQLGDRFARQNHPVVCVDYYEASRYCAWQGARLPTEQEWEKAARGSTGFRFPWGNEDVTTPPRRANIADKNGKWRGHDPDYDDGFEYTSPVGMYPEGASPYGALDMAGNVQEWTSTRFEESMFPNDENRVIRGGSYSLSYWYARASNRVVGGSRGGAAHVGFRCVKSVARDAPGTAAKGEGTVSE